MASYSIKQLSILSGVKAHTIRIWEKRYNLFSPNRTNTNIRRYSDEDLKFALNVSQLQAMGYKISQIASLTPEEISNIVTKGNLHTSPPFIPESLLDSAINMDYDKFADKINESIESKGLEWTYEYLIIPFQKRMGDLWLTGGILPAQEHFATNVIRERIISLTQALPVPSKASPKILFFLPENEFHELGLLFSAYISKSMGFRNLYLGQTVPIKDVLALGNLHKVGIFFTSITKSIPEKDFKLIFEQLNSTFQNAIIIATGNQVETNKKLLPKKVIHSTSPSHFKGELANILKQ
jgi:MerR family transcriptional regulator, light-induced transcriptional regulator